jgi:hypothetical protein
LYTFVLILQLYSLLFVSTTNKAKSNMLSKLTYEEPSSYYISVKNSIDFESACL